MISNLKADFYEIKMTKNQEKMTLKTHKYAMKILFNVELINTINWSIL